LVARWKDGLSKIYGFLLVVNLIWRNFGIQSLKKRTNVCPARRRILSLWEEESLIKAALSNIPIYYMSLFSMPIKVAMKIEQLQRSFLWEGGGPRKNDYLFNWKEVCKPKEVASLGIENIVMQNKSLLRKWLWRFTFEEAVYGTL